MIYNESFINSKILSNYFKGLCRNFIPPYKDSSLTANRMAFLSNTKVTYFLSQIERLIREEKCDAQILKDEILNIKDLNLIHLEVFWYLEAFKLVPIRCIIRHHESNENEEVIKYIAETVFDKIKDCRMSLSVIRKEMVLSYIKAIFQSEDSLNFNLLDYSVVQIFLNLICNSLKSFFDSEQNDLFIIDFNIHHFIELCKEADIKPKVLSSIFQYIVEFHLNGPPQIMRVIYQLQENIKNNVLDTKLFKFFQLSSKYCELGQLLEVLKYLLCEKAKAINWKNLLIFITFLGMSYDEGWSQLKKLTDFFLMSSFQNMDSRLLSFTFLVVRQCCFEKSKKIFPSYLQWYTTTFCEKSSFKLHCSKMCDFLFDFLKEVVCIDPVYYTKVHINRIPNVPSDCQSIVNDYVTLAKSRLSDLNASTDLGICDNTSEKSAAAFDVEHVIDHFKKTNNILNSVFQASMFSKSYFEKKFLVELLSKFEGKSSPRHKLIQKLHSLGKIPEAAYNKYRRIQKN